jgi:hypothetical protein
VHDLIAHDVAFAGSGASAIAQSDRHFVRIIDCFTRVPDPIATLTTACGAVGAWEPFQVGNKAITRGPFGHIGNTSFRAHR